MVRQNTGREGDDEQSCSLIGSQGLRERGERGLGKGLGTQHSLKGVPSFLQLGPASESFYHLTK